jgi:hypothetical protein
MRGRRSLHRRQVLVPVHRTCTPTALGVSMDETTTRRDLLEPSRGMPVPITQEMQVSMEVPPVPVVSVVLVVRGLVAGHDQ